MGIFKVEYLKHCYVEAQGKTTPFEIVSIYATLYFTIYNFPVSYFELFSIEA